ncbi:MAG: hypothetical protein A2776_00090 [Candidatus Levybacteria bacterium RIFCSPHIGHO2_01_FULL_40_10]|nr:MAG: hypothetical protein A2776_00090 [Candidatus Levybacteria bacterium RIFCSPHIGHO2_01_FULL_40_10]
MSTTISSNPCTRCGKERIEVKTWVEKVQTYFGKSEITHTETACPDADCQKIVQEKNDESREKKELMEHNRSERMKNAQKARTKKKAN